MTTQHHWLPQSKKIRDRIEGICPGIDINAYTTRFEGMEVGTDHHFVTHILKYNPQVEQILNAPNLDCCMLLKRIDGLIEETLKQLADHQGYTNPPNLMMQRHRCPDPDNKNVVDDFKKYIDEQCDDPNRKEPQLKTLPQVQALPFYVPQNPNHDKWYNMGTVVGGCVIAGTIYVAGPIIFAGGGTTGGASTLAFPCGGAGAGSSAAAGAGGVIILQTTKP